MTYIPSTGTVADNNYGDVTVTSSGMQWDINDAAVQLDDVENINASRILGRTDASAGAPQQIILGPILPSDGGLMATTIKVLGQSNPSATTLTTLYTAATAAVASSIVVCNRSATATSFRIAVRPAGAAISNEHYLYYDLTIAGSDTFIATIGITLAATDVVSVYATLATLSFNLFGQET
jgi:hypothetical protein